MLRSFALTLILIGLSLNAQAWRACNGNRAMWLEMNTKSPDCAAIFRTTIRKTEKSAGQTTIRDTFLYEGPGGKGFMDSEMNFDFSNKAATAAQKEAASSQKYETQLTKAEKGLKESKKTYAEIYALKPTGEQVPDDEEKNIFSRVCSMVPDAGFQGKSPCPPDMKGFKLNAQIILCKDAAAAAKKK